MVEKKKKPKNKKKYPPIEKQNWGERERESIDLFCCGQLGRNRGEGWK